LFECQGLSVPAKEMVGAKTVYISASAGEML
jgi:hypothetical protein